jgi:hypothetical protein
MWANHCGVGEPGVNRLLDEEVMAQSMKTRREGKIGLFFDSDVQREMAMRGLGKGAAKCRENGTGWFSSEKQRELSLRRT